MDLFPALVVPSMVSPDSTHVCLLCVCVCVCVSVWDVYVWGVFVWEVCVGGVCVCARVCVHVCARVCSCVRRAFLNGNGPRATTVFACWLSVAMFIMFYLVCKTTSEVVQG